jgi:hypothetical protein
MKIFQHLKLIIIFYQLLFILEIIVNGILGMLNRIQQKSSINLISHDSNVNTTQNIIHISSSTKNSQTSRSQESAKHEIQCSLH